MRGELSIMFSASCKPIILRGIRESRTTHVTHQSSRCTMKQLAGVAAGTALLLGRLILYQPRNLGGEWVSGGEVRTARDLGIDAGVIHML
jgi:hypothetical protein